MKFDKDVLYKVADRAMDGSNFGLTSVNGPQSGQAKFGRERRMIASPSLSPSAVTTENALQARSLMAPEFHHHMLSTRIARISNLMAEAPRFKRQIDILA